MPLVSRNSRLRFAQYSVMDGFEYWELVELPDIPERADDLLYTVKQYDRLDTLAYDFYGDPQLWFVIAKANDFDMPTTELNESDIIRIPSPTYIRQSFFNSLAKF